MSETVNARAPIDYIQRTREQYAALGYPSYQWVHNEQPPPWVAVTKPLSECRLALIASGGIYVEGQVAFHFKDDFSYRIIDTRLPSDKLRATHFAYDLTDARNDINVVFPIDTLRDLVAEHTLGSLSPRAYTFMGGIYSARKVREILAPALTARLLADAVDLAILVPV